MAVASEAAASRPFTEDDESSTTPISSLRPRVAANSRQSPAAAVNPVLIPVTPGKCPSSGLTFFHRCAPWLFVAAIR